MKRLWAPWRMSYIKSIDKKEDGCIFCTKPAESDDKKNLIVYRGQKSFIILNAFPYSNGHLLVIPYLHTSEIDALDPQTSSELWENVVMAKNVLKSAYRPDGFNIGMNMGRIAGAGIDQHLHIHIVPRWNGDTNFMPVLSDTRVISEGLEGTYNTLLPFFKGIS
ncbi:MAG TPA: HIT family hydrolase [Fibrobacteres bacterium]|jgi:ATP adenylyltransferase|nr:HIT family hydrolase [Fibrobacterota bacterium]